MIHDGQWQNHYVVCLIQACKEGATEVVTLLLEKIDEEQKDPFINAFDNNQNQALHYAVESHSLECVKVLVENG